MQNHERKISAFSINTRKIAVQVCTVFLLLIFLFPFSSGSTKAVKTPAGELTDGINRSTLSTHDTDGDGLSDSLEDMLDTDKYNKYGDKDADGLYDFEEYLDLYGTPEDTDTKKYDYNDNSTYGDLLDIYHKFNLTSNKAGYLRDTVYRSGSNGFKNYLLWNVNFSGWYAGGSYSGDVNYVNNTLHNVIFSGYTGGSRTGDVNYINNTFRDVTLGGFGSYSSWYAGGSAYGPVKYINNTLTNVTFSKNWAGASWQNTVNYTDNTLLNVTFRGRYTSSSGKSNATYENNNFTNVRYLTLLFAGRRLGESGVSVDEYSHYINNSFAHVQYAQLEDRREDHNVIAVDNTIVNDSYDTDADGLGDIYEFLLSGTESNDSDSDNDGLNDGWEVTYNGALGVNPYTPVSSSDLVSDEDSDGLTLSQEEELGTNPADSDTDGDGLGDRLERDLGTDARDKYGDLDRDGLYDFEEYLDFYGTPDDTSDTPKYKYNDNSTYGDLLDIYHKFGLGSNKAGYLRDTVYTVQNGGFTNYLLWNVTFSGSYAGGSYSGDVSYTDNTLSDVTFSGSYAGGSYSGDVNYTDNTLSDVTFSSYIAGGSRFGDVSYAGNTLSDVTFSGNYAGGSDYGDLIYSDNTLFNVVFRADYAGGSWRGDVNYTNNELKDVNFGYEYSYSANRFTGGSFYGYVSYYNNSFQNVSFVGKHAGGSNNEEIFYSNNTFENVVVSGKYAAGGRFGPAIYSYNTLSNVVFSGEASGGSDFGDTIYRYNSLSNVTFSGQYAGGSYGGVYRGYGYYSGSYPSSDYGNVTYRGNTLVNVRFSGSYAGVSLERSTLYSANIFSSVRLSLGIPDLDFTFTSDNIVVKDIDSDGDGTGDIKELFVLGTNPYFYDTDGDGLSDDYELKYGLSPNNIDTDGDGLNDSYELEERTNPLSLDTDGDGLNDSYELVLGTNASNKYGDRDNDFLYDFEEILGFYGNYNYNNSMTYGVNDSLHVAKHFFGHAGDITEVQRGGAHNKGNGNHLTGLFLWDVLVGRGYSNDANVSYINNLFVNVTFYEYNSYGGGGTVSGDLIYQNNTFIDVTFNGNGAGGSEFGNVLYENNTFENVTFSGHQSGGSPNAHLNYTDNTFINVVFAGSFSGTGNTATYSSNLFVNVDFTGDSTGIDRKGSVSDSNIFIL